MKSSYKHLTLKQAEERLRFWEDEFEAFKISQTPRQNTEYWKEYKRLYHSVWYWRKRTEELSHA